MPRKLKVYRTPIGFHDAYVAAPSQKAALEAWGSDANLFARGVAEQVDDPALTKEPLAHPGKVIRRLRGTAAEQLAALPPDDPGEPKRKAKPKKPAAKPKPRPGRGALDAAEQALAAAEARWDDEEAKLRAEEAALARRRRALAKARTAELARLGKARDRAATAYERALRKWREPG